MPWTCPACQTPINHREVELRPRPAIVYRCHVCRLEWVLDASTDKLELAPLRRQPPPAHLKRHG